MRCPVCGKEMERGFVQSSQRTAWVKKPSQLMYVLKETDVEFISPVLFSLPALPADICKKCRKIVVDYSTK